MRWGKENNGGWEGGVARSPRLKLRAHIAPHALSSLSRPEGCAAGSRRSISLESGDLWSAEALFSFIVDDSSGKRWDKIKQPYYCYILGL